MKENDSFTVSTAVFNEVVPGWHSGNIEKHEDRSQIR